MLTNTGAILSTKPSVKVMTAVIAFTIIGRFNIMNQCRYRKTRSKSTAQANLKKNYQM